jgi:proline utilization trans-activator
MLNDTLLTMEYMDSCSRCRQHKIKCTGENPCSNCTQRNTKCQFEKEVTKVQITRRRLSELHRRNRELEKENHALQQRLSDTIEAAATPQSTSVISPTDPPSAANADAESTQIHDEHEDINMVNPLSSGPPEYITDPAGNLCELIRSRWLSTRT